MICTYCAIPHDETEPHTDLDFAERAAIREEAPMSREDAERLAIEDLEKWREDLV